MASMTLPPYPQAISPHTPSRWRCPMMLSQKLNPELPKDPEIPLLDVYPEES